MRQIRMWLDTPVVDEIWSGLDAYSPVRKVLAPF